MGVTKAHWGNVNGAPVVLFRITSASGSYVELTNYGATVVRINVPNRNGKLQNVILGFDTLEGYLQDSCYIGSTIGPFANRIAKGRFRMDGVEYHLETNDGSNTNHGASAGFNAKVFDYYQENDRLIFRYLSKDMEAGYPGNLFIEVTYQWTNDDELRIEFKATTDKKTVVNFTNHCYFNLTGSTRKIFDHRLTVDATSVIEAGDDYIPTGRIINAAAHFFTDTRIADRMTAAGSDMRGLNICYALDGYQPRTEQRAAVLTDLTSSRQLTVYTTYPGLMLYTGDYLNSNTPGGHKVQYQPFDGLCLECQYFPDSPNHLGFPSTVLLPKEVFMETITYAFNTIK